MSRAAWVGGCIRARRIAFYAPSRAAGKRLDELPPDARLVATVSHVGHRGLACWYYRVAVASIADDSPVDEIARAAIRTGARIAVAESLTSGLIAARLGRGPDASAWFAGGVVAYRTDVKTSALGMTRGLDPVSSTAAKQLAHGVRVLTHATVAVSVTGVGGPDAHDGHPPGTVYLGWSTRQDEGSVLVRCSADPAEALEQTVESALAKLHRLLT